MVMQSALLKLRGLQTETQTNKHVSKLTDAKIGERLLGKSGDQLEWAENGGVKRPTYII